MRMSELIGKASEKVNKVVDVASQKAADIEEQIDKKREIKKLEAEIEEHKNLVIQNIIIADQDEICLPANVSKHINAIIEKAEYIDEVHKEMLRKKGIKVCSECCELSYDDANFCSNCGSNFYE